MLEPRQITRDTVVDIDNVQTTPDCQPVPNNQSTHLRLRILFGCIAERACPTLSTHPLLVEERVHPSTRFLRC